MNAKHAFLTVLPIAVQLSGCASTSPNALSKYQPPPVGQPAAVIRVGPNENAWSVDGAETSLFTKDVRLVPGEHRVGINCLITKVTGLSAFHGGPSAPVIPVISGKTSLPFVQVTGSFQAGQTYYTRCSTENGQTRVWLAEAADGNELPQGFTSICTRECPP